MVKQLSTRSEAGSSVAKAMQLSLQAVKGRQSRSTTFLVTRYRSLLGIDCHLTLLRSIVAVASPTFIERHRRWFYMTILPLSALYIHINFPRRSANKRKKGLLHTGVGLVLTSTDLHFRISGCRQRGVPFEQRIQELPAATVRPAIQILRKSRFLTCMGRSTGLQMRQIGSRGTVQ